MCWEAKSGSGHPRVVLKRPNGQDSSTVHDHLHLESSAPSQGLITKCYWHPMLLRSLKNCKAFPGGVSGKERACQCRKHKRRRLHRWSERCPWRRAWPPSPVFLPGESHAQRSTEGWNPQGNTGSDTSEAPEHTRTRELNK